MRRVNPQSRTAFSNAQSALDKRASVEKFAASLDQAQEWAASVGYQEKDVNEIIKAVRKKR